MSFKSLLEKNHIAIFFFLFTIHYFAAYPGGLTPDSSVQFYQSLDLRIITNHQPPLMSLLWSVFNYIYAGPQTMLLFHLLMLWGSFILLYKSDENNKYRWLYFILPFIPSILVVSGMVWKDIGFAYGFLFCFTVCVYYKYQQRKPSVFVVIMLLLLSFYATEIKFQAKFVSPIILFFIATLIFHSLKKRIVASVIMLLTFFCLHSFIMSFSGDTKSHQLRQFFDLAAIAVALDDDSIIPEYIKESPVYSFDKLKERYSPRNACPIIFGNDRVYDMSSNDADLDKLESAFYLEIFKHPIHYIKHRVINYWSIMNINESLFAENAFIDEPLKVEFHRFNNNFLHDIFSSYVKHSVLKKNKFTVLLWIIFLITMLVFKKKNHFDYSNEHYILLYIIVTCITFSVTIFFTSMANDYRFYSLIRLLTWSAIPIFLKYSVPKFESLIKKQSY